MRPKRWPLLAPCAGGAALVFWLGARSIEHGAAPAVGTNAQERSEFVLGVGVHLTTTDRSIQTTIDLLSRAGVKSLRDDAPWSLVETRRGELRIPARWDTIVDEARSRGIVPLLIFDYGNRFYDGGDKPLSKEGLQGFVRYARAVVEHFKGRVPYYEIWNEWNTTVGHTTPGDAGSYLRLVRQVYPVVKTADPEATFLVGATSAEGTRDTGGPPGFLRQLIASGLLNYGDGLSLHTYVHCARHSAPEDWVNWMQAVKTMLQEVSGKQLPVYVTEMGWPTFAGPCGVTEETQAKYLARLLLLSRTLPFVKGLWWYDLQDDGTEPLEREHHFGLVRHDSSPKSAYLTLTRVTPVASAGRFLGQRILMPGLRALNFEGATRHAWTLWSESADLCFEIAMEFRGTTRDVRSTTGDLVAILRSQRPDSSISFLVRDAPIIAYAAPQSSVIQEAHGVHCSAGKPAEREP